jgi:hypothetical protein
MSLFALKCHNCRLCPLASDVLPFRTTPAKFEMTRYDLSAFTIDCRAKQASCPNGRPVSGGHWDGMFPVTPSCASTLTQQPAAPVRPARRAPGPKTPRANSPSGRMPTTRQSKPSGNGKRPLRCDSRFSLYQRCLSGYNRGDEASAEGPSTSGRTHVRQAARPWRCEGKKFLARPSA